MASNHTVHFGLNQWAATDPVLREDFNADNASIEEALAEMTAELEGKGNLYFECGSYVGTGEFTSANPNTLTFSKRPLFVLVACEDSTSIFPGLVAQGNNTPLSGGSSSSCHYTWSGNTLSWYSGANNYVQMNMDGKTYRYLAVMAHGWTPEE